jgi:hypothetical protein
MEMGWKRGNRRGGLGQKNAEMIWTESARKSKEDVATFLAVRASRRIHVRLRAIPVQGSDCVLEGARQAGLQWLPRAVVIFGPLAARPRVGELLDGLQRKGETVSK